MNETNLTLTSTQTKHWGFAEWLRYYKSTGTCSVRYTTKGPFLYSVAIKFGGSLAATPSLKNQKVKGTNVLRARPKAQLAAMSYAFNAACPGGGCPRFDPAQYLVAWIECGARRGAFDEDNVATTIKDWLEPEFIRNKNRGWGVGIVKNDKTVTAIAQKKPKGNVSTEIFLLPFDLVMEDFIGLGNKIKNLVDKYKENL